MTLTRQKLHAELRKAGFAKTRSTATRIRGWHDIHTGYRLWEDEGAFYVGWVIGNRFMQSAERIKEEDAKALRIAEVLAARNPKIEPDSWGRPRVIVSK